MKQSKALVGLAMALGLAGALAPSVAEAQRRRPRRIELPAIEIEGRLQRPAFYVLTRTENGYQVLDLRTTFTNAVVDSVRGGPF